MAGKLVNIKGYREQPTGKTPDKVIQYKIKCNGEKVNASLLTYKMERNSKVIGYVDGSCESDVDRDYLTVDVGNDSYDLVIKEKRNKFSSVAGWIPVGDGAYVGLTKDCIPVIIILLLLLLALLGLLLFAPKNEMVPIEGDKEGSVSINDNVIDLDSIPDDVSEVDLTQDMAYISGQSMTTVKESYQNVYLQNDKENTDYTIVYEVYVNGAEDYVYKTGNIPSGSAEPWNAYECPEIKLGENDVRYEVYVYDKEGVKVAETTLSGLTVIKK